MRRDRNSISRTTRLARLSPARKGSRSPKRGGRSDLRKTFTAKQFKEAKNKKSLVNISPILRRFKNKITPPISVLVLNNDEDEPKEKDINDQRKEYLEKICEHGKDINTTKNMLKDYYKTFYKKNDDELQKMFLFK